LGESNDVQALRENVKGVTKEIYLLAAEHIETCRPGTKLPALQTYDGGLSDFVTIGYEPSANEDGFSSVGGIQPLLY